MKAKIPEEVKEQIKKMRAEGKEPKEIIKFVFENYSITIRGDQIWHICNYGEKKLKAKTKESSVRTDVKKKVNPAASASTEENPQEIIKEIKSLLEELNTLYVSSLKAIRAELIKACAKLRGKEKEAI